MVNTENPGVIIFDDDKSHILTFDIYGLSDDSKTELIRLASELSNGFVDSIHFIYESPGKPRLNTIKWLEDDIRKCLKEAKLIDLDNVMTRVSDHTFSGLHQDLKLQNKTNPVIRYHKNTGTTGKPNIPDGVNATDFEPYFLIGRPIDGNVMGRPTGDMEIEKFKPTVAISQQQPTWTLFRLLGDGTPQNPSLAHCVIPRKSLELSMSTDAVFSGLDDGTQTVSVGDETAVVTARELNKTLSDNSGNQFGAPRDFAVQDFTQTDGGGIGL
ncbi:MAG: hypothetical protein KBF89_08820 [Acidimicrobiia bacterium]|nr:hypothetical protein [Acidimicrobiia bacterium]